ncbi:hypothetical protein KSS87_009463 [Heliosperma pusillum]|nr:hypothetical protein KSS87_009463 [Heliosperma pusillum]
MHAFSPSPLQLIIITKKPYFSHSTTPNLWKIRSSAPTLTAETVEKESSKKFPAIKAAKRVVLVRHGQSTWNAEGRIQGSSNFSVLTPKGEAQAETSRQMLLDDSFDVCFTSPLSRSKRTAEIIWDTRDAPMIPDNDLREIDLYSFQGLLKHEGKEKFGPAFRQWQVDAPNFVIDDHYPVRELWARARSCWDRILANESKSVLVVAHNAVNQALVATAIGLGTEYFRVLLQSNCGVSVLDFIPRPEDSSEVGIFGVRTLYIVVKTSGNGATRLMWDRLRCRNRWFIYHRCVRILGAVWFARGKGNGIRKGNEGERTPSFCRRRSSAPLHFQSKTNPKKPGPPTKPPLTPDLVFARLYEERSSVLVGRRCRFMCSLRWGMGWFVVLTVGICGVCSGGSGYQGKEIDTLGELTPGSPIAGGNSAGRKASSRIILACHGTSENSGEVGDQPMNMLGVIQSQKTAELLLDLKVNTVLSSPRKASAETAKIISQVQEAADCLGADCVPRYVDVKEMDQLSVETFLGQSKQYAATDSINGSSLSGLGDDVIDPLWDQTGNVWQSLVNELSKSSEQEQVVVAVGHPILHIALMTHCLNLTQDWLGSFHLDEGSISVIDFPDGPTGKGIIRCINYTAHLGRWSIPITKSTLEDEEFF